MQWGLLVIHRKYNRSKLRSCVTNFKRKTPAKMTPIACKAIRSSKAHEIFNAKLPMERATLDDSKNMHINVLLLCLS